MGAKKKSEKKSEIENLKTVPVDVQAVIAEARKKGALLPAAPAAPAVPAAPAAPAASAVPAALVAPAPAPPIPTGATPGRITG